MAYKRVVLQSLIAQSASGNGGAVSIPAIVSGDLFVNLTAITGTTPTIDLFLQASDDSGTTWYDVPADLTLQLAASASANTAGTNKRDVLDGVSAAGKFFARYAFLNAELYRVAWYLGGTTPVATFSAILLAK